LFFPIWNDNGFDGWLLNDANNDSWVNNLSSLLASRVVQSYVMGSSSALHTNTICVVQFSPLTKSATFIAQQQPHFTLTNAQATHHQPPSATDATF
jgi:hypothetical protein